MAAITSVVFYNPPVIAGFKEDMMSFVEKVGRVDIFYEISCK